ncbi:MAG: hypothetical protein NC483_00600 [Ruminococcus sp.]|nr:hypothetical protein [Ruminococcus sp.]
MEKIKLIDLLVKKANKEQLPRKLKIGKHILTLNEYAAFYDLYEDEDGNYLFKDYLITLNDELEIIEDKLDFKIDNNGYIHTNSGSWKARKMDIEFAKALDYLLKKEDD